jgi:hypothetical protein
LKLLLVLISLGVIYKGVMDTGDPKGFFSSTAVFYAMLLLDYYSQAYRFKNGFLKFARFMMMVFTLISVMGVIDIFTIREIQNQYYISFSDTMRLGTAGIINVHWLFLIMAIIQAFFSALEWVYSIDKENNVNNVGEFKKRGA